MSEYRRRQAWTAGAKGYAQGKLREENNRQPGTIFYDDWCDGFDHAANEAWRQGMEPRP